MSNENIDAARRVLATLGQRDPEALIALAAPEVEWHSLFAFGDVYRGYDGTRQYVRDLEDAWEIGRADLDDALAVGDLVLLVGRIHYRGKGSGVEAEADTGWLLKFRDGKLICFRAFRDPADALEFAASQKS
jgi:ketosteroid isomerase-like protein